MQDPDVLADMGGSDERCVPVLHDDGPDVEQRPPPTSGCEQAGSCTRTGATTSRL